MIISALKPSSKERITVVLADGEEIRSTLGVVTSLRLFAGRELDGGETEALRTASETALAREKALELVSRRLMSEKELLDKLTEKGFSEQAAESSTDWLRDHGFLDDESYAAAIGRHYAAKGYGAGRVRSELIRRGIPRELWDTATDAMPESGETLDRLISSKLKHPDDRDEIKKISNALYRRGYSWDEIRAALGRYRAEIEDFSE